MDDILQHADRPVLVEPAIRSGWKGSPRKLILVPLDGSPAAEAVLPWAKAIARECDGVIGLLRVVTEAGAAEKGVSDVREAERYLIDLQVGLRKAGFENWHVVAEGRPVEVISHYTRALRIDLVVMATHSWSDPDRRGCGQVSEGVLRETAVPVLLIPSQAFKPVVQTRDILWILEYLKGVRWGRRHESMIVKSNVFWQEAGV